MVIEIKSVGKYEAMSAEEAISAKKSVVNHINVQMKDLACRISSLMQKAEIDNFSTIHDNNFEFKIDINGDGVEQGLSMLDLHRYKTFLTLIRIPEILLKNKVESILPEIPSDYVEFSFFSKTYIDNSNSIIELLKPNGHYGKKEVPNSQGDYFKLESLSLRKLEEISVYFTIFAAHVHQELTKVIIGEVDMNSPLNIDRTGKIVKTEDNLDIKKTLANNFRTSAFIFLNEISDGKVCNDRSCLRCRIADIAFIVEKEYNLEPMNYSMIE